MVHYTFQHVSIITKLSQNVTQYYKNIISLIGAIVRYKEIYKYIYYKRRSQVTKGNSSEQGAWRDRDGLSMIHATTAHL